MTKPPEKTGKHELDTGDSYQDLINSLNAIDKELDATITDGKRIKDLIHDAFTEGETKWETNKDWLIRILRYRDEIIEIDAEHYTTVAGDVEGEALKEKEGKITSKGEQDVIDKLSKLNTMYGLVRLARGFGIKISEKAIAHVDDITNEEAEGKLKDKKLIFADKEIMAESQKEKVLTKENTEIKEQVTKGIKEEFKAEELKDVKVTDKPPIETDPPIFNKEIEITVVIEGVEVTLKAPIGWEGTDDNKKEMNDKVKEATENLKKRITKIKESVDREMELEKGLMPETLEQVKTLEKDQFAIDRIKLLERNHPNGAFFFEQYLWTLKAKGEVNEDGINKWLNKHAPTLYYRNNFILKNRSRKGKRIA